MDDHVKRDACDIPYRDMSRHVTNRDEKSRNVTSRHNVTSEPSMLDKPLISEADRPQWQTALDAARIAPKCGAKRRNGEPCRKAAMANGSGKCRLHGGASLRGKDHPGFKHGDQSKEARERRRELQYLRRCLKAGNRWL